MHKLFIKIGAIGFIVAILLGAFGAHSLKKIVTSETLQSFQTGVQYQFYHAIALLFSGILFEKGDKKYIQRAGVFFILGTLLFSGSLYIITMMKVCELALPPIIALLTPLGGLTFIVGWLFFLLSVRGKKL